MKENTSIFVLDEHLVYFEDALAKNDRCDFAGALESWNCALAIRDSAHARWNRGQAYLSLGNYREGFADYAVRWRLFPNMLNPGCDAIRTRLPLWRGEDIRGKHLVLLGEAGMGDVIMLARFIPMLQDMGVSVALAVPQPLHRLLAQLAPIGDDGDVCCPFFDLMQHLSDSIPSEPYLIVDPALCRRWRHWLSAASFDSAALNIGIAWKASTEHKRDFKRSIPLGEFVDLLDSPDTTLCALQPDERDLASELGVAVPPYKDLADVAAVASLMDVIVCADVCAIHVAGAIGHRNAHVLLPWLSSWRWLGDNVWYPHVKRHQQTMPGDWTSAFARMQARAEDAIRSDASRHQA